MVVARIADVDGATALGLFVMHDEEPSFKFLEIKAPGDQLRPEQGAWIDYLNGNGLPASILKLRWKK